jgi:hypothetical protein
VCYSGCSDAVERGNGIDVIKVDASTLDLSEPEAKIIELLAKAEEPSVQVQTACAYFDRILSSVFSLLAKDQPWRYWGLDDLWCEVVQRREQVITMQGTAYWLEGGSGCERFRLDVDLTTDPLLYSYKFSDRRRGKQVLYVGKTPDGWVINGLSDPLQNKDPHNRRSANH